MFTKGGLVLPSPKSEPIEGQFIVVFHPNVTDAGVASHMERFVDADSLMHEYNIASGAFRGYSARMSASAAQAVAADVANVETIEADQTMWMQQSCERQVEATWSIVRTNQRDLDIDGKYVYHTGIGEDVHAYIIDTGIYVENIDFEGRALLGPTFVPGSKSSVDEQGHGTHVAGTVMSKTWGIAKAAKAIAVQVLGADGSGSNSGVIAGIDWCASDYEAAKKANPSLPAWIANLSLGGGYSSATNRAVDALVKAGLAVAVAAGNEDQDACYTSPASASGVVSVGATTVSDDRSYFSNYGKCVDVFGPGSDITSTWIGKYSTNTISGTSMASPAVAGVMAKYASTYPSYSGEEVQKAAILQATVGKISDVKGSANLMIFGDCS